MPALPAQTIGAADVETTQGELVVSEHNPSTAPEGFYVQDPDTGQLRPYVFVDESSGSEQRFRVRIGAETAVGYQDFVFDGPSGTMAIHAGNEVILEKFDVRAEERGSRGRGDGPSWRSSGPATSERLNGRGAIGRSSRPEPAGRSISLEPSWLSRGGEPDWRSSRRGPNGRSDGSQDPFSYQLHPDYAEITLHQSVNPAIGYTTTFRIGFDGEHVIHEVSTELKKPGDGRARGLQVDTWFRMQGLPASVSADGHTPGHLDLGILVAEWLGPFAVPAEIHSPERDTIEWGPADGGLGVSDRMAMSIGAPAPGDFLTVTSPGRFELRFSETQGGGIHYWFDLENDPNRTQNLVRNNTNLFAHRIKVDGGFYATSKLGSMEVVSQDSLKAVIRQHGTYNNGSPTLDGTTYEITYTIWATGQVGIELVNQTSVARVIDVEERQLQVSASAWLSFTEYGPISSDSLSQQDADYVGFSLSGGAQLNADAVLVQRSDWDDAGLIHYRSGAGGHDLGWTSRSSVAWPAGYSASVQYLLLLKPDTLNSFDAPAPYVADYRSPELSVSVGTGTGFDFGAVAYGIEASSNHAHFSLGNAIARFQPRFVVTNWSEPDWSFSFAGDALTEGVDYLAEFDSESMSLTIVYLGVVPEGSTGAFTLTAASFLPTITSMSPPAELTVVDEAGPFAIPYIQESPTLDVSVVVDDLPPNGGVEFLVDGDSTLDMSEPFETTYTLAPGEYVLEAYIVDSSGQRMTNPEAYAARSQIGIGTITTTIGDSITAGNGSDSWATAITECAESPYASPDCRNFFQHSASSGVWYAGYQISANQCLAETTGAAQFLLNDGYGGITSSGILNRMSTYVDHIEALGASRVFLLMGTNDGNQLVPVEEWQANVEAVIGNLVDAGIDPSNIYLGHVPYRLGGGAFAQERRERMQEYNAQLPEIAADTGISIGPDFYSYYENNQQLFDDNLHFTQEGYDAMGGLWTASVTGSTSCVP